MTQWLRPFIALAEDPGAIRSIHMVRHNHPSFKLQGTQYSLFISKGTWQACDAHAYMQEKLSYT